MLAFLVPFLVGCVVGGVVVFVGICWLLGAAVQYLEAQEEEAMRRRVPV
jgi:hypothetical protein